MVSPGAWYDGQPGHAGTLTLPEPDVELDVEALELLLEDELLDDELEVVPPEVLLLEDELLDDELVEVVELEPVELLDEELLEELLLEVEVVLEPPLGIEHSFTPPETLVPAPKVTSPQTKLPLSTLKVKRSARP
jgi:hypothetical protein